MGTPRGTKNHPTRVERPLSPRAAVYGKKLRDARAAKARAEGRKKIPQGDLAKFCGVTQSTVARWERGQAIPPDDRKLKVAEFYGLPVDWLFPREVPCQVVD